MPSLDYFILGEGPVVLILHGWGQNKEMMLPIANKLKKNYTCIVVDLPGFGNSSFNGEKNLDEYCKTIHDFLLLKLHVNVKYIIGHSFGGKVAVHYYLKYKKIKGITLIASPILKPKRNLKYYYRVYLYKIKKYFNQASNLGSEDYKNTSLEMRKFFVKVVNTHYNKLLKKIYIPILLIYSLEDEKVSFKNARVLKKKINNSHLRVIKGDHFAYLSNIDIVSIEVNNFIKEIENKREFYL